MMEKPTQDEILEALKDDDTFKQYAREVAKKALMVQFEMLQSGSPSEQQSAARAFMPLFTKLLTEKDEGRSVDLAKAEVRDMVSSMLTRKKKATPDAAA